MDKYASKDKYANMDNLFEGPTAPPNSPVPASFGDHYNGLLVKIVIDFSCPLGGDSDCTLGKTALSTIKEEDTEASPTATTTNEALALLHQSVADLFKLRKRNGDRRHRAPDRRRNKELMRAARKAQELDDLELKHEVLEAQLMARQVASVNRERASLGLGPLPRNFERALVADAWMWEDQEDDRWEDEEEDQEDQKEDQEE